MKTKIVSSTICLFYVTYSKSGFVILFIVLPEKSSHVSQVSETFTALIFFCLLLIVLCRLQHTTEVVIPRVVFVK